MPQDEMVVVAGDMKGHVRNSNLGYNRIYGSVGYGCRNADGSRILEFADGLNLVICNTLFMKHKAKLVNKTREYTILEDGHVVFVVEVLVETQYSVLSARNGCTGSVVV